MSLPRGVNKIIEDYCTYKYPFEEELKKSTRRIKNSFDMEMEVYKDMGRRFDTNDDLYNFVVVKIFGSKSWEIDFYDKDTIQETPRGKLRGRNIGRILEFKLGDCNFSDYDNYWGDDKWFRNEMIISPTHIEW